MTKVCGASTRFHERNGIRLDSVLDRTQRLVLRTKKDSKDLYIHADLEVKDPVFGIYMGGGTMTLDIKDALKEPSKIPGRDETFEINCKCESGKLKCKGRAWEF